MEYENKEEQKSDRARVVIPSVVVVLLLAAVVTGVVALGSGRDSAKADTAEAAKDGKKGEDGKDEKEKTPVPVSVTEVRQAAISSYISATANLVAENQVDVIAETEGRVLRYHFTEGSPIASGAVLATLVPDDAEIAVRKAEVRARSSEVEHERLRRLYEQNLISRGDFDKIAMDRDVAAQELAEAKWGLSKTVIRSPFAGVVSSRQVTVGQHIRPGDVLFTITDPDPLIADIYLPERDAMTLAVGTEARITLKANEKTSFKGRVRQVSPVVDVRTGTVKVTVEAAGRPVQVRPGAFVTIDITRETRPAALILPREAVIRELQNAHVFIASGNTAKKRVVTLGLEEGEFVEALGGVKPGEKVIVAGQGGLKDGSPIKVLAADSRKES
ncbi:MAG TPA: efflux RND transporter periplasmic adaptor subunit [Thermoanaerobaculia bacterium]|nr:efflux RND transporter periplasmic adaptor subunit [Thermoanaerobaculia bacterium]